MLGTDEAAGGLGLTTIAERIGLSKSATFAIVQTLLAAGFVSDAGVGKSRRYHLGLALARLGTRAKATRSVPELARPVLEEVAVDLNQCLRLGVIDGNRVEVVERIDSPSGIRIDLRMGQQEMLHSTAIGKAIISTWDPESMAETLGAEPFAAQTQKTLTALKDLQTDLARARDRGWAVDDEEDYDGILCIGAPITAEAGDAADWAISTTTLKAAVDSARIEQIGAALAAAGREIGQRLAGLPG